ncbi:Phospho-N-acetylmuramoyl-pentapeptide-transferase [Desulfovibrio sp. X2]|uniref:phospho-N-acetylmuramoyl-pentapeptide- transferase n=1 Tax=Desulfovibrio sp. X2 TaxID=941449 RepID=UPI000358B97A|nr:phospho-N-acetylmuramoyl-pentapeptide-transferase [Desulfovibrio sp. X2]EPR44451.1 Phospho-N-acetylmuramoyl-pentapeptide-transferase [Desulfovibrio sp. X2]
MLYNLLFPLSDQFSALNVFRYITFRSIYAFLTALIIAIAFGPAMIRWLTRLKCGQCIHEDVKAHASKAGTPTMGGLLIMAACLPATLLWADISNSRVWLVLLVFCGFGAVGLYDDYLKVCRHKNKGLSAKAKFLGQIVVAGIAVAVLLRDPAYSTKLAVPFFKNFHPDLFWMYVPFAILVMVGASNGVNLTDGLDGLAIVPTVVAAVVFGVFVYVAGNVKMADYLQVPYVPGVGEITVFCSSLLGAGLGFLWFNAYPAQIFMGDVGSLSLGGALGFVAVTAKQELLLVVVGGLFVIETLSVIVQVGYFKMTGGKRIFRMAPLHHHFEMKGIPESKIIIRFWIISVLFALVALSTLKLR